MKRRSLLKREACPAGVRRMRQKPSAASTIVSATEEGSGAPLTLSATERDAMSRSRPVHAGFSTKDLLALVLVLVLVLAGLILNQMAYMAGRNTRVMTVPARVPPISV